MVGVAGRGKALDVAGAILVDHRRKQRPVADARHLQHRELRSVDRTRTRPRPRPFDANSRRRHAIPGGVPRAPEAGRDGLRTDEQPPLPEQQRVAAVTPTWLEAHSKRDRPLGRRRARRIEQVLDHQPPDEIALHSVEQPPNRRRRIARQPPGRHERAHLLALEKPAHEVLQRIGIAAAVIRETRLQRRQIVELAGQRDQRRRHGARPRTREQRPLVVAPERRHLARRRAPRPPPRRGHRFPARLEQPPVLGRIGEPAHPTRSQSSTRGDFHGPRWRSPSMNAISSASSVGRAPSMK